MLSYVRPCSISSLKVLSTALEGALAIFGLANQQAIEQVREHGLSLTKATKGPCVTIPEVRLICFWEGGFRCGSFLISHFDVGQRGSDRRAHEESKFGGGIRLRCMILKATVRTTALCHLEPPKRRRGPTPFHIGPGCCQSLPGEGAAQYLNQANFLVCANEFTCNLNGPYTPIHTMIGVLCVDHPGSLLCFLLSHTAYMYLLLLGPPPRALEVSARRSTMEEASPCSIPRKDIGSDSPDSNQCDRSSS